MDAARTQRVGEVLKSVATLGKNVKQPAAAAIAPNVKKALTEATSRLPVATSGWLQIGFYILAGLLAIALILLAVDQWITPIFQRLPGGSGYIPIPGTDTTQIFWKKYTDVSDIPIRPVDPSKEGATTLENRNQFGITMDVYISDEYPQSLPPNTNRTFFILGTTAETPKLRVSLDNNKNTLVVTFFTNCLMSLVVDNVPIRKPFRLGIIQNGKIGEAYLNGKLVRSVPIGSPSVIPQSGDSIFSPSGLVTGGINTAAGIKVLNLQTYGYAPTPQELAARMNSLLPASAFL